MAVSIMSPHCCCRHSLLLFCFLVCLLHALIQGQVFLQSPTVFLRSKRANLFFLEELLQGNLERECYEELCNFEEAREFFEDYDQTVAFWTVYNGRNQCEPNPCLHGGNCTDKVGGFHCSCPAHHFGQICEQRAVGGVTRKAQQPPTAPQVTAPEMAECPTEGPAACQQMCRASHYDFTCSCMSGFKLHTDKRSCLPEVEFPCGRFPENSTRMALPCHHGNCPWQVSLVNSERGNFCSGVLLGQRTVLTSAHCLLQGTEFNLRPSSFYVIAGNGMELSVRALYIHNRFHLDCHDNDLALLQLAEPLTFGPALFHLCLPTKDFSENILMHPGRRGVAARPRGRSQELFYMTLDECRSDLNVSHPLTNKMFCMRRLMTTAGGATPRSAGRLWKQNATFLNAAEKETLAVSDLRSEVGRRQCSVLPGSPVATVEEGTVFLTGLLMTTSSGCNSGLVFTKVSRYLMWIRPRLEASEDQTMTRQFPH